MNVEDKLNSKTPKDTPLLWIGYILLALIFLLGGPANAQSATDNEIFISTPSSSDDLDLTIQQAGYNQEINFSIGGARNIVDISQTGTNNTVKYTDTWGSGYNWGGDLAGDDNSITIKQHTTTSYSPSNNYFGFHISGNNNTVNFGQGYNYNPSTNTWTQDNDEYGGMYVRLDIHGNNNNLDGYQRNNDANDTQHMEINLYSNYNDVFLKQREGDHYLSLTTNNDYNDVDVTQIGTAAKSATITLGGSYGTTLNLLQQGTTNQTYTLTQDCQTAGGCSVSVTQGQ